MNTSVTASDIQNALKTMTIVCDAIREAGSIPSGLLYGMLMEQMTYETYQSMLKQTLRTGLVKQDQFHRLIWIG